MPLPTSFTEFGAYLHTDANDTNTQVNTNTLAIALKADDSTVAHLTGAETLTGKTLTTPKIARIHDANGNIMLDTNAQASAVNYLQLWNKPTGDWPEFVAQGADTNIGLFFTPKGTGPLAIWAQTGITNATVEAQGVEADVGINLKTKGSGTVKANSVAVLLSGGALGTPSSGTLTNATGLPISGLVNSTSAALGVGTIELGHGSDTTISRTGAGAIAVEGVAVLLSGGALGTPASGTLTNCTGLPVAGITASTATALGVGSLEVGHASDTTITRSASGVVAVEGKDVYMVGGADAAVTDGGTGRSTSTTAYGLIAAGTTATGAHQTLAAGATTEILVGGGASALPAWTTATGSGAPVRTTSPTLDNPTVTNYVESVVAIGNTSTSKTISLTSGTVQTATATGNCTWTMPTATAGKSFVLLYNTGAGSFTATFTGVKWSSAGTPVLTTTASKLDIFSFFADGTNWYGSVAQGYTP